MMMPMIMAPAPATVPVGMGPVAFGRFIGPSKVTSKITWNNPGDITYGTTLSGTQLDATGSVPGQITYNPPSGTVLSAGPQQTLTTTLTPTDNSNYTQVYATASINVTQATPTISWKNPANIKYKTALSSAQLDATFSVPGKFVYTPPSGTLLSAETGKLDAGIVNCGISKSKAEKVKWLTIS